MRYDKRFRLSGADTEHVDFGVCDAQGRRAGVLIRRYRTPTRAAPYRADVRLTANGKPRAAAVSWFAYGVTPGDRDAVTLRHVYHLYRRSTAARAARLNP